MIQLIKVFDSLIIFLLITAFALSNQHWLSIQFENLNFRRFVWFLLNVWFCFHVFICLCKGVNYLNPNGR